MIIGGVSDRHDKQRLSILLAVLVFYVWACKMSIMLLLRLQLKLCVILYAHCSVQSRLKLLFVVLALSAECIVFFSSAAS